LELVRGGSWSAGYRQQGSEVRGHGPRGSTGAHLSKEVRSGVAGHVAPPEPTSAGRCGPKLQLVWQHVDARTVPYLDLELICGVPDLQGADSLSLDFPVLNTYN
jgi:hypothetical protein